MVAIHRYDSDGTSGSESGDDTAPNNRNRNNTNNNNNNNNHPPGSWRGWKERGKQAYLKGDYASALQNYSQALHRQNNLFHSNSHTQQSNTGNGSSSNMFPSRLDRQILLSNMVACRLKLGGAPQAEAAVANAQKCISIDPQWPKGHLRLAEAYLALGKSTGNHERRIESSNKACEALQKVIDLDPTHQAARNLLTKEFRYSALHGESRTAPEPSAPPEYMDENRSQSSNANTAQSPNRVHSTRSNEEHQQQQQQQEEDNNTDNIDIEDDSNYVFTPSWQDRLEFWVQKVRTWYAGLSEDDKSLVKLGVLFVVLYVAFGGRFGLEYLGKSNVPSPRTNAVYDEFYQSRSGNHRRYDTASYNRHGGRSYGSSSSSGYRHSGHSSSSWQGGNSWGTTSSSTRNCSSCFGGQYSYVLLVLGLSYVGHRFFGIGPYQVLFLVNMLMGRRNNRWFVPRRRYGWGQGWGQGMYFNPRAQYRHPPRGMWG